jgi:flavin reductase (DIM6/NTAB) family NADH-FMN oxidoreductase RutF/glyoxylase-like metal-dependent hydrolase (beta-lactamase superfamily II)
MTANDLTRTDAVSAGATDDAIDGPSFRHVLGHFLTGVTVATTVGPEGEPVGMTANAFTSVSLDPPLVLLSVARSASSNSAMEQARRYAVHILHYRQNDLSSAFARSAANGTQKFEAISWRPAPDGLPLLDDCLARIECTIVERIPLGDHVGYVGRVDSAVAEEGMAPLGFFRGKYGSLTPAAPTLGSRAVDARDGALAEQGIRRLSLPTPFAVGRLNAYLIEDDPLTLIDVGPNSAETLDALEENLRSLGHRVEDLQLVVVTHQHMDHFGLVQIVARRSGADVAAIDALEPWLRDYRASIDADDEFAERIMRTYGVGDEVRSTARAVAQSFHPWGAAARVTVRLRDGEQLTLRDRALTVGHRPGHSPSDTTLLDQKSGILFGGDHLIAHISSNAKITRPLDGSVCSRPQALITYIDSLARTRESEVSVVLAGHGEPIDDHLSLIDRRFAAFAERAEKLAQMIEQRRRSGYELAVGLFGNVAVTQTYLTLSEVLGHVDLLMNDHRVREVLDDDGIIRFEAV